MTKKGNEGYDPLTLWKGWVDGDVTQLKHTAELMAEQVARGRGPTHDFNEHITAAAKFLAAGDQASAAQKIAMCLRLQTERMENKVYPVYGDQVLFDLAEQIGIPKLGKRNSLRLTLEKNRKSYKKLTGV